jgi:hypothetical protein
MKRTHLNALIDAVALVVFLFLLTTGLLLEYQLPPGSGGVREHAVGLRGAGRSVHLVWGWTRHEWGQVHYWIALSLTAVLAIHLALHWKWIVCTVRGKATTASGYRLTLGVAGLVFTMLLSATPLVSTTTSTSHEALRHSRAAPTASPGETGGNTSRERHDRAGDLASIRGSMTIREIAGVAGVPVDTIASRLDLPPDVNADGAAGRTLREHGLSMSDLREALAPSHGEGTATRPR